MIADGIAESAKIKKWVNRRLRRQVKSAIGHRLKKAVFVKGREMDGDSYYGYQPTYRISNAVSNSSEIKGNRCDVSEDYAFVFNVTQSTELTLEYDHRCAILGGGISDQYLTNLEDREKW